MVVSSRAARRSAPGRALALLCAGALGAWGLLPQRGHAVPCASCDLALGPGGYINIDGDTYNGGIAAGTTICLRPGGYTGLFLRDLAGDSDAPITLRNCEGPVAIVGRIQLYASRHVALLGDGASDTRWGIQIDAAGLSVGVAIAQLSSDVEVAWLEIFGSDFAGIMFKTDNADPLTFTQYNSVLHHNYIHDVAGEAIYLGNSFYSDTEQHRLVGTRVYENIAIDTGWDGMQVGAADQDTLIYNNYVEGTGQATTDFQQRNGYQLGQGTRARFFGNVALATGAHGLIVIGYGGSVISDNLFVEIGAGNGDGIWYSPRTWTRPAAIAPTGDVTTGVVASNTIVHVARYGYQLHSVTTTTVNVFANNLVVDAGTDYVYKHPSKTWQHAGFVFAAEPEALGFVRPLRRADLAGVPVAQRRELLLAAYGLRPSSPALDAGSDLSAWGLTSDALGNLRPDGPGFDAGAREGACDPLGCAALPGACGALDDDGCGVGLDCGPCPGDDGGPADDGAGAGDTAGLGGDLAARGDAPTAGDPLGGGDALAGGDVAEGGDAVVGGDVAADGAPATGDAGPGDPLTADGGPDGAGPGQVRGGCEGCNAGGASGAWWLVACLALVLLRRRAAVHRSRATAARLPSPGSSAGG